MAAGALNDIRNLCTRGMADDYQLEGFGSDIQNNVSVVMCDGGAGGLWLPYEFIGGDVVTRVFLCGEESAGTRGLVAGEPWSIVFHMTGTAGARNWSLLASMIKHMLRPMLLVVAPDVGLPAAFLPHVGEGVTIVVYRWLSEAAAVNVQATTVFFPPTVQSSHIIGVQRALWRGLGLRVSDTNLPLILQETRPQGLGLASTVLEGNIVSLAWYRMKDSDEMVEGLRRNALSAWLGAISDRVIGLLKR